MSDTPWGDAQDFIDRERRRADDAEQRLASMTEAHDQQREGWCRCLLELGKVSDERDALKLALARATAETR